MVGHADCIIHIHILMVRGESTTAGLHLIHKLRIDSDRSDRSVVMCTSITHKLRCLVLVLESDQRVIILLLELLLLLLRRIALRYLPLRVLLRVLL